MSPRAAAKPRSSVPADAVAAKRVRPVVADASRSAHPSPARLAQLELAARLADDAAPAGPRRPRQGLAIAAAGSVVLWGALAMLGAALLN